MHIGFFTDAYLPQLNGIATNIEAVSEALERQGHTVSIFAPRMGDYTEQRARVYRLPAVRAIQDPPLWLATPYSPAVMRAVTREPVDVVHVHSTFSLHLVAWAAARHCGVPLVSTYHTLLPAQVHYAQILGHPVVSARRAGQFSAAVCNACDHVIAPSAKIRHALQGFGVTRPVSIVHNGVALGRFHPGPRGALRARFGLPPHARIMLAVGRLAPDKNMPFLVHALAHAARQPGAPLYLAIAGQGPLKTELEQQAAQSGMADRLLLAGAIDPADMPGVYADADLYVTSSYSEVQSVAALEAIATGLPAVAVDDPSFAGIIIDGRNGYVCAPDEALFAARVRSIADDEAQARAMGGESAAIAQGFTIDAQARNLARLYAELAAVPARVRASATAPNA